MTLLKTASLSDVCTISMGQAPKGTSYNIDGNGHLLIAGAGDFGEIHPAPEKWTDSPTKLSEPGDIILCIRATIGDRNWSDKVYCLGRGVAGLRADRARLDQQYLWHWIGYSATHLKSKGRGATFLQVSKTDIASLQIPPTPRRAEADCGDTGYGGRLAGQAPGVPRPARHAPSIHLPRHVRRPRYQSDGVGATSIRRADHRWTAKWYQNGIYKPSKLYGSGVRILRIDGFYDGAVSDPGSLKRVQISNKEVETYGLCQYDIVINRVNSRSHLGKCALAPALDEPVVFESNMMRLRLDVGRMLPRFATEFLQTQYVKNQILNACKNAVNQSSINQRDVKNFQVLAPPLDLQHRFASIVEAVERQKRACAPTSPSWTRYSALCNLEPLTGSSEKRGGENA